MADSTADVRVDARRVLWVALGAALLGGAGWAAGYVIDPGRARYSYLAAVVAGVTVCLGGLGLLQIVHVMNAKWPVVVRRWIEGVVSPLPVLALGFVPVAFWIPDLYAWARPASDEHVAHRLEQLRPWLDAEPFCIRSAIYLLSWLVVAAALLRWSSKQDQGRTAPPPVARAISGATLPAVALTVTFAAFDWVMSLHPTWYSSVFGLYLFCSGFSAAVATVTVIATRIDRTDGLGRGLTRSHDHALGRCNLAAAALCGYIAFFQFLIIWVANKPGEVGWYLVRIQGGWQLLAAIALVAMLVVPLPMLLFRRISRHRVPLGLVAVLVVVGHVVHMIWLVVPVQGAIGSGWWIDVAAAVMVLGAAVAWAAWRVHGRPALPIHDPRLLRGARYESR